ncbi:MAG: hypothetical protein ACYDEJ_01930 [Desulfitobacteriaceae bacterium]
MALFTTGLVDNPPVAGIRPSASIDVLLVNDNIEPIDVLISGFYVSGGVKVPYVLELFTLAAGALTTRNYFAQFDIFEFEFEVTLTGVEISVWGKDTAGNINAEHRLVPEELDFVL